MPPVTVTYSKNVFIPLTNLCRNDCGYCGFRSRPGGIKGYIMRPEEVRDLFRRRGDAKEALFTFGERIEETDEGRILLDEIGYSRMTDYLIDLCEIAIEEGLLPHTNMGVVDYDDLRRLKPLNASMGLMLETTAIVDAHRNSPGKDPALRVNTIEDAGRLRIPFTTGILLGIGERREDRIRSLQEIARIHEEYGHIQEVIIQPFHPKPGTRMENHPPPTFDEIRDAVMLARRILPDDVAIQVPPNLTDFKRLIACGANDLGGISSVTPDYINPEAPWPSIKELQRQIFPYILKERLPVYPKYIEMGWMGEKTRDLVLRYSNELEGDH